MINTDTSIRNPLTSLRNHYLQDERLLHSLMLSINTEQDPKEQKETTILVEQQEIFEEAKVDEEDEESIKDELKWLINYYEKKPVSDFSVKKTKI